MHKKKEVDRHQCLIGERPLREPDKENHWVAKPLGRHENETNHEQNLE